MMKQLSDEELNELIFFLKNEGSKGMRTRYCDSLSSIRILMDNQVDKKYSYKSMNQFLINELKIKKPMASYLINVAKKFYLPGGEIKPFYKGFQFTALTELLKYNDSELEMMKQHNLIHKDLKRSDREALRAEYLKLLEENNKHREI